MLQAYGIYLFICRTLAPVFLFASMCGAEAEDAGIEEERTGVEVEQTDTQLEIRRSAEILHPSLLPHPPPHRDPRAAGAVIDTQLERRTA